MGQRGTQQGRRLRLWLPLMHGHSHGDSSHHPRRPRVRQFGVARCVALLNDGGVCQLLSWNAAAIFHVGALRAMAVQGVQAMQAIGGACARQGLASEPQPAPERQVVYPLHQQDNQHQRSRLHRHSFPYSRTTSYYCIARLIFSIAKQMPTVPAGFSLRMWKAHLLLSRLCVDGDESTLGGSLDLESGGFLEHPHSET